MAITTYSELKTKIASQAERSDLTSDIPDFITLAESRLNRDVRVREMEAQTTLTPSSGAVTMPADFLEIIRVTVDSTPKRVLVYVTPEWADDAYPTDTTTNFGSFYTLIGSSLKTIPQVTSDVLLTYYEKIDALSDSATTNWLLTRAPDVYLWASMVELCDFIKDEAGMARFEARYQAALGGLLMANAYAKSGTPTRRASNYAV
jgi:hypothetical protein